MKMINFMNFKLERKFKKDHTKVLIKLNNKLNNQCL